MTEKKAILSLERVVQAAKELALEAGAYRPTLMIQGDNDVVAVEVSLGSSPEERANQMYEAGYLLASMAVVGVLQQVFFISEGWMSIAQDGKLPEVLPSQDSQRKEVLIISQADVTQQQQKAVILEMKRDKQGKLTQLETFIPEVQEPETRMDSPLIYAFVIGFLGFATKTDD